MGRIRTVKPELFTHEALFDAEQEEGLPLRLAFIGLFTICDRDGRFEWRPRMLKTDVLPYDDIDFSRVLDALARRGFVVRYECDGHVYGCIPSWRKHQFINNRETQSELPAPTEEDLKNNNFQTRAPRVNDACATRPVHAQGEGEGEGEKEGESLPTERGVPESPTPRRNLRVDDQFDLEGFQGGKDPPAGKPSAAQIDGDFEDWWSIAWLKVGKGAARKAYRVARNKASRETLKTWANDFGRQMADREPKYRPHPATALNAERWLDQPTANNSAAGKVTDPTLLEINRVYIALVSAGRDTDAAELHRLRESGEMERALALARRWAPEVKFFISS